MMMMTVAEWFHLHLLKIQINELLLCLCVHMLIYQVLDSISNEHVNFQLDNVVYGVDALQWLGNVLQIVDSVAKQKVRFSEKPTLFPCTTY